MHEAGPSIHSMISIELMNDLDMSDLSVHALKALVAIHSSGSLSRAAERLGVNQSTLSHSLKRLRAAFGDALFVRQGRGIVPTARCDTIVAEIAAMLGQLDNLARPELFDPAASARTFTVSCNFYERAVILPALLTAFRREAPNAHLRIIQSNVRGHEQLRDGLCDLLISPLPTETAGLYRRHLLAERYACFLDPGHPLAKAPLTLEAYGSAQHVAISYDGGWRPFYRAVLHALGVEIVPRLELPSFGAVGEIIAGTDLVLTAPAALAPVFMPRAMQMAAPFDCSFDVHMFWMASQHQSPANQWLRGLVVEAVRRRAKAAA
jgi:DNA-binding transcriptional LysR family regulator